MNTDVVIVCSNLLHWLHIGLPVLYIIYILETYFRGTLENSKDPDERPQKATDRNNLQGLTYMYILTLKAPITTAADDKFYDIFSNFRKK